MGKHTEQKWEKPAFVEINMSSEIGAYQDDFDSENMPFVSQVGANDVSRRSPRFNRAMPSED